MSKTLISHGSVIAKTPRRFVICLPDGQLASARSLERGRRRKVIVRRHSHEYHLLKTSIKKLWRIQTEGDLFITKFTTCSPLIRALDSLLEAAERYESLTCQNPFDLWAGPFLFGPTAVLLNKGDHREYGLSPHFVKWVRDYWPDGFGYPIKIPETKILGVDGSCGNGHLFSRETWDLASNYSNPSTRWSGGFCT